MTSTYAGKPKPQLVIDNRRKRNGFLMYSKGGHIAGLYENAIRAVVLQVTTEERFHTSVGVHPGCLLSPSLFNICLEDILTHALDNNNGTISNGGRNITNYRFADSIDGIRLEKDELTKFVQNLDTAAKKFGMDMNPDKTKIMTNNGTLQRDRGRSWKQ